MAHLVKILGTEVSFPAEENEFLLDAAAKAGIDIPHACRLGFCGMCAANLTGGKAVFYAPGSASPEEARVPQKIMCCRTMVRSDSEIELAHFTRTEPLTRVKIAEKKKLSSDVIKLVLKPVSGDPVEFVAGQFVDFVLPGNVRRSYSVACDSQSGTGLELHIRRVPGGLFTEQLFDEENPLMAEGAVLEISKPAGEFRVKKRTAHDIVFLVTGTGFAPAKAMIENYIRLPSAKPHEVYLYWGGKTDSDLYMNGLCREWDEKLPWFHYCPVLSRASEDEWSGRCGHVQEAFLAEHPDASGFDFYLCGSGPFVNSARETLAAAGADPEAIRSDAFTA